MKTPNEIKKGLECCTVEYCYRTQKGCPYRDYSLCVQNVCADALAYIQQLERERDEVSEFHKELVETNNNLFAEGVEMQKNINALRKELKQVKRERDAAVEDMRSILGTGLCHVCKKKHTVLDETGAYICEVFDRSLNPDPTFCGQFEWRGVQE